MNLNGQGIGGIENFEEEGEAMGRVGCGSFTKDFFAMFFPELMKGCSGERSVVDFRLLVGAVANLPGFPDGCPVCGHGATEDGRDSVSAPYPCFRDWREREWESESCVGGHGDG